MDLNLPSPDPSARSLVPQGRFPAALFVVGILVTAGVSVAVTAAYFELRPAPVPVGVKVVDDFGRTVSVPYDPARVVAFGPSIVDSMYRLGLRSHLVAVDCSLNVTTGSLDILEDYTVNQSAQWNLSSNMCLQAFPLPLNTQQLLSANPTVVLASTVVPVSLLEEFSISFHIPVLFLAPSTMGGIVVDLQLLGEIFPVGNALAQLTGQLQTTIGRAAAELSNLTSNFSTVLPTVLLTYYVTPAGSPYAGYFSYGPGTFGQSLLEAAGASSISANSTIAYPELSGAQVLAANPDLIICGTAPAPIGELLGTFAQGPNWNQFPAVQNHHVHTIDVTWITEPDATMILVGLTVLLNIAHPGMG